MTWVIQQDGWDGPIGRADFSTVLEQSSIGEHSIIWERWQSERIRLSRTAYMLALQGMAIPKFFNKSWFEKKGQVVMGPFLLLRCHSEHLWSAVPDLFKVILGRVIEAPKGVQHTELLGALITRALRA